MSKTPRTPTILMEATIRKNLLKIQSILTMVKKLLVTQVTLVLTLQTLRPSLSPSQPIPSLKQMSQSLQ